jgi:cell division protein FtsB
MTFELVGRFALVLLIAMAMVVAAVIAELIVGRALRAARLESDVDRLHGENDRLEELNEMLRAQAVGDVAPKS